MTLCVKVHNGSMPELHEAEKDAVDHRTMHRAAAAEDRSGGDPVVSCF